jgi:hypothetical protein
MSRVMGTRLLMFTFWWLNASEEAATAKRAALATSEMSTAVESEQRAATLMVLAGKERKKEGKKTKG